MVGDSVNLQVSVRDPKIKEYFEHQLFLCQ